VNPETQARTEADFIIIGAGIAGASVGYWLAPFGRVVILERELQPGYHATGRSAAIFVPGYGNAQVRAITRASLSFMQSPPAGFAEHPLLSPRGVLVVASEDQLPQLESFWHEIRETSPSARRLSAAEACAMVPALRPSKVAAAVYEADAFDIDVHALHQGFLKGVRRAGGQVVCDANVSTIERSNETWTVTAGTSQWTAPLLIDAAGAWADIVAELAGVAPLGLVPKRRSACILPAPADMTIAHWPMVLGATEDWYIKPDAGALLASPANADPVPPQDVQPEDLDIALAMYRVEEMTTLDASRPKTPWAGLRTFSPDGGLVGGFDDAVPGFFWLAAQGGYGIQTSPAMGEACAALVRGLPLPAHIAAEGLKASALGATRLRHTT
jgi:D-arginine dehydrogenase